VYEHDVCLISPELHIVLTVVLLADNSAVIAALVEVHLNSTNILIFVRIIRIVLSKELSTFYVSRFIRIVLSFSFYTLLRPTAKND